MMCLTEEQLDVIEQMAYQLFTPNMIALAIEVDEDELMLSIKEKGSDAHRAFYKGYFKQMGEVRTDTIKAAHNGSNPAQLELIKMIGNIQREIEHG